MTSRSERPRPLLLCLACGHPEPAATAPDAPCSTCGAPRRAPPASEWPPALRRHLVARLLAARFERHGGDTDAAWRDLLASTYRGRRVPVPRLGERPVAWAASPDELFGLALRDAGLLIPEPDPA